jgi:DNA polymerase-3 subunit gamma/tau
MLGTIDQSLVFDTLQGLIAEDGQAILAAVAHLAEHAPDYSAALAELIAVLHRIAIAQIVPEAIDNSLGDRQQIYDFARAMAAEDVQLYYQTALLGRRDLPLSPDPRGGFEMVLLRMLAFKPQGVADVPTKTLLTGTASIPALESPAPVEAAPQSVKKSEALAASPLSADLSTAVDTEMLAVTRVEPQSQEKIPLVTVPLSVEDRPPTASKKADASASLAPKSPSRKISLASLTPENWLQVYKQLEVGGLLQSTVANSVYTGRAQQQLQFVLDEQQSTLYDPAHQQRLAELLTEYFQEVVQVVITLGQAEGETPAKMILRQQQERQRQAESAIHNDPVVKQLQQVFGAIIVDDSIKPVDV